MPDIEEQKSENQNSESKEQSLKQNLEPEKQSSEEQNPEQKYRNVLQEESFLNEYQIKSVLGKPGGFGVTYLALDTNLHQLVAIKEYLPNDFAVRESDNIIGVISSADKEAFEWGRKSFIDESRILARFHHPNIVRVLRFFEANNTAYMVMEYQKGENLTDYLKSKGGTLSEKELLDIVLPLLDGLEEIHKAGLLHRDIKPNNIYIRHDNTPVLLDFGSARYAIGQKSRSVTSIVTPNYAPLEQYDNEAAEQGAWTDIYALGAVMYLAIKGEPPPPATRRVVKDPMIPAVDVGRGRYSRNLLRAVDWALEPNERERPQNVSEFRKKILEEPVSLTLPDGKEVFIAPRWLVVVGGGIFLLLIAAALSVILYQNNEIVNERILRDKVEKQNEELKKQEILAKTAQKIATDKYELAGSATKKLEKLMIETSKESLKEESSDFAQRYRSVIELSVWKESKVKDSLIQGTSHLPQKYYDVINVNDKDVLNIRQQPSPNSKIVGEIPPNEHCISYLNELEILEEKGKCRAWFKVEYNGIQGWVNSYYITGSKECPINIQETVNIQKK